MHCEASLACRSVGFVLNEVSFAGELPSLIESAASFAIDAVNLLCRAASFPHG